MKQHLKKDIEIDGEIYVLVKKDDIKSLEYKVKDQAADINELKNCVTSVIKLMGLFDDKTGTIKASVTNGTENYFKYIIKAIKDILALVMQSQIGFGNSEKELAEKFAFIKTVLPLVKKYT